MADRDRSHHYQTSYGLTQSDVESMIESQGGLCAICGERPEDRIRLGLGVDHCHETGAVRGMLCSNCNRAIGLFGDRVETVMSATSYLLAHEDALATLGGDGNVWTVAEALRGAPSQEQARGSAGLEWRVDAGRLGPRARPRLAPDRHSPLRERRNVRAAPLLPGLRLGFAVLHLREPEPLREQLQALRPDAPVDHVVAPGPRRERGRPAPNPHRAG